MLLTPNTPKVQANPSTALPLHGQMLREAGEAAGGEIHPRSGRGGGGGPHVSRTLPTAPTARGRGTASAGSGLGAAQQPPALALESREQPSGGRTSQGSRSSLSGGSGTSQPRCTAGAAREATPAGPAPASAHPASRPKGVPLARDSGAPGPDSPTRGDRRARR